jgi:hypothetical protein
VLAGDREQRTDRHHGDEGMRGLNGVLQRASVPTSIRSLGFPEPLGRRNDGKSPRPTAGQPRHRIEQQTYKAWRDILASDRWQRLANLDARPQGLCLSVPVPRNQRLPTSFISLISLLWLRQTRSTLPYRSGETSDRYWADSSHTRAVPFTTFCNLLRRRDTPWCL